MKVLVSIGEAREASYRSGCPVCIYLAAYCLPHIIVTTHTQICSSPYPILPIHRSAKLICTVQAHNGPSDLLVIRAAMYLGTFKPITQSPHISSGLAGNYNGTLLCYLLVTASCHMRGIWCLICPNGTPAYSLLPGRSAAVKASLRPPVWWNYASDIK